MPPLSLASKEGLILSIEGDLRTAGAESLLTILLLNSASENKVSLNSRHISIFYLYETLG
jgi:hypothetical protein